MSSVAGQLMAAGLQNFGSSVGGGLARLGELARAKDEEEKSRSRRVKSIRTLLAELEPDAKPRFDTMGLDEAEGYLRGTMVKEELGLQRARRAEFKRSADDATRRDLFAADLDNYGESRDGAIKSRLAEFGMLPGEGGAGMAPGRMGKMMAEQGVLPEQLQPRDIVRMAARRRVLDPSLIREVSEAYAGSPTAVMPVATEVGGRKLLVNPKTGQFQDVTPVAKAEIPAGMDPQRASVDKDGNVSVDYGITKAEGKGLTQGELGQLTALSQAGNDLATLEKMYKDLGPGYAGPVSGRVKATLSAGQNPNIAALENAITAATPNLARGVFREVGVLTDEDIKRYKKLLPAPYDTDEVRKRKISQLRARIAAGRKEVVEGMRKAGRDVGEFSEETEAPLAEPTRYDSEGAARKAGAKSGDVILLYDRERAKYRRYQLH